MLFRNLSKKSDLKGRFLSFQNYFSEVCWLVEVGIGQRNGIPTDEMRLTGLVRAFVEVRPQFLREHGRLVTEDERERNAQFYLPCE